LYLKGLFIFKTKKVK